MKSHAKQLDTQGGAQGEEIKASAKMNNDLLIEQRIKAILGAAAKLLKHEVCDLQMWFDSLVKVPNIQKLSALYLMMKYALDPLCDEVSFLQWSKDQWLPYITIDGWTKLMNQHAAFAGICFSESPEVVDGIPVWMECVIYRTDRIQPISVREYFTEVVTENALWKNMPRRMLRHRTLQQAIRLAFGISGGSVVEAQIPSQLVDNKGSSQSPRQSPIFSMAKGFGDLPTQNGLASKRTEQLKEILNHVK